MEEQSTRGWKRHNITLQSENWHMLVKNLWKQPSAVNLSYQNVDYIKPANDCLLFPALNLLSENCGYEDFALSNV